MNDIHTQRDNFEILIRTQMNQLPDTFIIVRNHKKLSQALEEFGDLRYLKTKGLTTRVVTN